MHAYLDWLLSGDTPWLSEMWPRIKKAIEFAWVPGGWDANKDGVLEGVQHNTYDVNEVGITMRDAARRAFGPLGEAALPAGTVNSEDSFWKS
ncbi:MAG: GH116 family glycosyl hydrolase [Bryobacteraceae bacterium]